MLQNKSKYMYDPKSDSFLPKGHNIKYNSIGEGPRYDEHDTRDDRKGNFIPFMKRFTRNLFLLTGGILWCGVAIVTLFVDIKESTEFVLQLKDNEEEIRLFAFYDIAQSKTELASMMSKDKNYDIEAIDLVTRMKEFALHNALTQIKNQDVIIETLGKPVQLTGYRAAAKLDGMVQNFQNLTQFGIEKSICNDCRTQTWTAECLIEGPKGLASLNLEFERPADQNEWILSKVIVESLEKSGRQLLNVAASLPEGVKLSD